MTKSDQQFGLQGVVPSILTPSHLIFRFCTRLSIPNKVRFGVITVELVVEERPVGFAFDPLPALPQDDGFHFRFRVDESRNSASASTADSWQLELLQA